MSFDENQGSVKVDVKWLDGQWTAFMPKGALRSAGIMDIVDQVTDEWPPLEKGRVVKWSVVGNKFVVRDVDAAQKKLSKSDE